MAVNAFVDVCICACVVSIILLLCFNYIVFVITSPFH